MCTSLSQPNRTIRVLAMDCNSHAIQLQDFKYGKKQACLTKRIIVSEFQKSCDAGTPLPTLVLVRPPISSAWLFKKWDIYCFRKILLQHTNLRTFLDQWFSDFSLPKIHLEDLVNQSARPLPQSFPFNTSLVGVEICISKKLSHDNDAAGQENTLYTKVLWEVVCFYSFNFAKKTVLIRGTPDKGVRQIPSYYKTQSLFCFSKKCGTVCHWETRYFSKGRYLYEDNLSY